MTLSPVKRSRVAQARERQSALPPAAALPPGAALPRAIIATPVKLEDPVGAPAGGALIPPSSPPPPSTPDELGSRVRAPAA